MTMYTHWMYSVKELYYLPIDGRGVQYCTISSRPELPQVPIVCLCAVSVGYIMEEFTKDCIYRYMSLGHATRSLHHLQPW